MANTYFQCKQFRIEQANCAQKVSEVACIQGAWTTLPPNTKHVLDIGFGTGLLTLMLAQRYSINIDAVELEPLCFEQGKINIQASNFASSISCYQNDIRTFAPNEKYDFIICNPPFFSEQLEANSAEKNMAKHGTHLNLPTLMNCIKNLLLATGSYSILLPFSRKEYWDKLNTSLGFTLQSVLFIKHSKHHPIHFYVGIYGKHADTLIEDTLFIREEKVHSQKMHALMKEYYL